jgi:acetyl-CoA synthetase
VLNFAKGEFVWHPTPELIAQSNLQCFMSRHGLRSLEELHQKSITDLEWFWDAVLRTLGVRLDRPYANVVDLSRGIQWPQWCVGGELNIVETCLRHTGSKIAIRYENEVGETRTLSYDELRREVNRAANFLRSHGLAKGEVVGVLMPMNPECVIAMLAIVKIGAIFLPLFSGFGQEAVQTRLSDAGAKALICGDGCYRRGKFVPTTAEWNLVLKPQWSGFPGQTSTERTSAEHPLMIIYTSGTTGKPKGAVHTHCGFPVKAAQDMWMGLDLQTDETLYWVTDMGWMMGPWEVFGTLILGATMLLYDGALYGDRLWSLVERHRVTALGVSPTLVRSVLRQPLGRHDLSSLRKFGSTGEPWNPEAWLWLFHEVGKEKLPIINYSGGTEISGGILMGNVLTPMKPCAFSGPLPGMAADVVDENGNSVRGRVGELVLRQPWIGMTRGFWNDPQRYLETYWSRFPDVWVHGDWAMVDEDGLWYILGRSDDTIKLGGKRLGPAEIESILTAHPAVAEAAAIGVPDELKGEALVCFCVLKRPASETELIDRVVAALGKAFKPRAVKFVSDLPKTRNAKVMRRVIRSAYLGEAPGDISSLENPEAVESILKIRQPSGEFPHRSAPIS